MMSASTSSGCSTSSPNPPIIAFQHCNSTNYILCFDRVLQFCPLCRACLDDASVTLQSPPVRLPSVIENARSKPYSLVIKQTHGSFLQSYSPGSFLHAGITNSKGIVYNFDEKGVSQDSSGWEQCVAILLLGCQDYELLLEWDALLHQFSATHYWTSQLYQESHNCFDFVVGFLNHVEYNQTVKGIPRPITRDELCKDYIVSMTTKVARRIELYRTIVKDGYVLRDDI